VKAARHTLGYVGDDRHCQPPPKKTRIHTTFVVCIKYIPHARIVRVKGRVR